MDVDVSGAVPAGERKLARIVRIDAVHPIEKAERVMRADVCGWTVVCKLNEFAPGDLAVYYEIGSIPSLEYAHTAFLQGKPIRTKKIFGVLSQGLLGPLSWLPADVKPEVDLDVTDVLGVTKWVDAEEMQQYVADSTRAAWPSMIPKTDEERIQNVRALPGAFDNRPLVLTQKYDGTSCTFLSLRGVVSVCGRNCELAKAFLVLRRPLSLLTVDADRLLQPTRSTQHYFDMFARYNLVSSRQQGESPA